MIQKAILKEINEDIEEEVTLVINGVELVGFANIVPYELSIGNEYKVILGITVLNDFLIKEIDNKQKLITRINNSFNYLLNGVLLKEGVIDAGIMIQDEDLQEYAYLIGRYIEIKVDRITVEFV